MERTRKTRKAKSPKAFIGIIFCIFSLASIAYAAQGDYSPQRDGITTKSHPYGLSYNDFNNFTDNYTLCYMRYWSDRADDKNCNKDYQDERDFLVAGNISDSDDRYYHTLNSADIGDTVRLMLYYHNNAEETRDNKYTAKDVTAYINYTDADSPQGRLYCSNCNNKNIYDLVTINASKQFQLEYVPNSIQIVSKDLAGEGKVLKLKDTDSRLKFSENEIRFSDGDVPGCFPHDRYIYFDFKVIEVVECSSLELTPSSANIEDFFDKNGDPVDSVTFGLKNVKPSDFDGNFSWKGESGGSFTSSESQFRLTQVTTNSKSDTVNFYADYEGAKLTVQSSEYANCTDYVTVGGRCGDSHLWEGKEDCDDGNTSNADECTTTCKLTYCGDKTKQSPNGEGKGGPKDDGYEDCDDGNTSNGDECTTSCVLTYCGDKIVQKPNGKHEKGSDGKGNEECDDANSSSSDQCTSSCEFTYCGDYIVQKPNGEKKGGPKNDGYEECDDGTKGSATCTTQCAIIEEVQECDSVSINNSEVLAIIETQIAVTVKPSDYTPALTWVASKDSGEFEGENPYFSGSDTSVSFEKGAIGEIIYVYDKDDFSCADQITVTGCEDLSISPTSIDLDRDTLPVTISLVTNPSTWNRELIFTSTDTTATFDGKPSGYRTANRKVLYTGTKESSIEIVDATGLYTNPTSEFPYDCSAKITVTKKKTFCGDETVQKPNDDGFYEECDDRKDGGSTDQCTDSCTLTFCGDDIIQKPNGRGTGGPKDDGNEECDDGSRGSETCTTQCTIIEEVPECDSVSINNSEVLAIIETQVSVTVKPSDYTPALTWVASEDSGRFEGENPYFSGSDTSVSFENGAIGEIMYVYDKSDLTCADQITVTGCEDLSVSPTSIDLDRDTLPVPITLITNPSTWNREMIFTSTDTTATFDGKPSGYRTANRKILYTGTKESTIEIVDATGLYTNPTPEFPYDCTAKITVTKEKTFCGDEIVQKPNDDGVNEECDGESYCSDTCTIVEELVCDSLTFLKEDFTEDQVSEGKKITLEVNPEPDTYPNDVSWQCTGNGKFILNATEYPCNNNQIYNFDVITVEYTGGKKNDTITAFDENFQSICRDSFKIGPPVTQPQPFCGDGHVDSGEQCDDGNNTSGDDCDATCQTEGGGGPFCGDGNVDSGEQCDDGNNISGDDCDATCQTEGGPPGGGACEIDVKTEDGFVLYDGSSYPEKISFSNIGIPLNFQIDNSGAEPYYLESKNKHSGNFSGIFTAYEQKWDSEADETGNPIDSSKHYVTLANPSGEDISRFENIGIGSVVTIRSMSEDCAAQFEFVEEGEEVPPGGEEVCVDLKASVDEFNANTRLPLMVELTPNPNTFEGKYNWTTTIEDISFNGSVKEYESVDRTVTLENSTGSDKFGTNGNINIKSMDYPEDCRVDIPVGDNDALVKGLICPRTQSNIASDGDIVDYAIIYYFEPTGNVSWVNIWDSIGQPSGIPGSLGKNDHVEMYSTPMVELVKQSETRITLTTCETGMTNICYEGRLDEAQGITIKNLKSDTNLDVKNDYIKISYSGKLHADKDLKCNEETTDECQAEYFLNEAKSFAYIDEDTGLAHTSYATVWAICPFLIAENTGDVFFEDSLGVGTDLSCIDPSLKNTTGLAVQEYTSVIPEGAMGSPIIPSIFNCESTGPDVIGRFSSFVCEIETVVDEQWKQTKIETRVLENAIQSTRYFEERESSAALDNLSINGLDTAIGSQSDSNQSHIYRVSGDLNIQNNYDTRINISDDGARTIIVEGDLSIFSNLEYDPNASKDYKKIPSIAFIVMGDIYIDPDVETLVGVFYTQNAFKSVGDADSNKMLTMKGSVYGDIEPLFKNRTGFGDPERNEGAITILYDERILLNTPPGLKDFIDITQTEVAR